MAVARDSHLLCIMSRSRSAMLCTTNLRNPLGSMWRVFLLDP